MPVRASLKKESLARRLPVGASDLDGWHLWGSNPGLAKIAEWHVRKDLCNKTVEDREVSGSIPPLQVCVAHGVIAWELCRTKSRGFCCIDLYAHTTSP